MKQSSLLLTFDYELYLGPDSGTAANCCLRPTEKILQILYKHGCKGIFFVDALYLVRLREIIGQYAKAKEDWLNISQQIQQIIREGHYVFNHLHPHWLDAKYKPETNSWNLSDKAKFAFSNLTDAERDLSFNSTMQVLYEIIRPVNNNYKITGFRAGGLFIQPFAIFKKYFDQHQIKYEFSVQVGAKCSGPANTYSFDFRGAPQKKFYQFSDEVTEQNPAGSFIEFPLEICEVRGLRKVLSGIQYRLTKNSPHYTRHGDGLPSGNQVKYENPVKQGPFEHTESFAIESLNRFKMGYYMAQLVNKGHLHIISHPKLVSDYNLEIFDVLLKKAIAQLDCVTDITHIIANK